MGWAYGDEPSCCPDDRVWMSVCSCESVVGSFDDEGDSVRVCSVATMTCVHAGSSELSSDEHFGFWLSWCRCGGRSPLDSGSKKAV